MVEPENETEDPDILRSMSVGEIIDDAIESFQSEVSGYASNLIFSPIGEIYAIRL